MSHSRRKQSRRRRIQKTAATRIWRPLLERLEDRMLLAAEFGFGSRLADTDSPLLPIMVRYSDTQFEDKQTPAYFNEVLFGPDYPNAVGYALDNSVGRFTFTRAGQGTIGPLDWPDDLETPVLKEDEFDTINVIAGGGAILFASLRVAESRNFLIACDGGGGEMFVNPDGPAAGTHGGNYETFKIIDLTGGGTLRYGDRVRFKTLQENYLSSRGSLLNAVPTSAFNNSDDQESFWLEHADSPTNSGEMVYEDVDPNDNNNNDNANKLLIRIRTTANQYLRVKGASETEFARKPCDPPRDNAASQIEFTGNRADATVFELEASARSEGSHRRTIIQMASQVFNFAPYDTDLPGTAGHGIVNTSPQDTNGDGRLDKSPELALLSITATKQPGGGGTVRWYDQVTVKAGDSDATVAGSSADIASGATQATAIHELAHLLGTEDLYGSSNLSERVTLMSSTPGKDDLDTDVIEAETFHLDPWHKMQLGWVEPTVFDISNPDFSLAEFNLNSRPAILYDSRLGVGEYFILEKRPTAGVYDADVTTANIPVPGVAVWYVRTDGNATSPKLLEIESLQGSGKDRSVFALSHFGTHIGDPMVPISRGAEEAQFFHKLWRAGDYRLRWASGKDIGVKLTIRSLANEQWRLRVEPGSSPALGGAIQQHGLGVDEFDDRFGSAVVSADFNGDGYPDLAVGAPGEAPGSDPKSGTVFVYHGSLQGLQPAYSLTQAGVGDNEVGDLFGASLAAGNFNGDVNPQTGLPLFDLAVGAPGEAPGSNPKAGAVFIFRGTPQGLVVAPSLTQSGLDPHEDGDLFGAALAFGDFNGDGADDLAVGAPGESTPAGSRAGRVYVFRGVKGSAGALQPAYALEPAVIVNDQFGAAMVAADFTDDGFADLVVGAPNKLVNSTVRSGVAYLYTGGTGPLELEQQLGQGGTENEAGDRFAAALAAGDFNADGIADLAVGAPGEDDDTGRVLIYSHPASGSQLLDLRYSFDQAGLDSAQANLGENEEGDQFGAALVAQDVTGDGVSDLVVGAPGEVLWDNRQTGAAFLFRASSDQNDPRLQPERVLTKFGLDSSPPDDERSKFGAALAIGDFNRDGFGDVAVGAPHDFNGNTATGTVFFFAGVGDLLRLETIKGTPNDDTWYVRADSSGNFLQIWAADSASGTPHYSVPRQQFLGRELTFNGLEGNDRLIVDFANGNPLFGSLKFDGGLGQRDEPNDVLEIRGSESGDVVTITATQVEVNGTRISFSSLDEIIADTRGGEDSIWINSTASGTTVTAQGGDQADEFRVGGGNFLINILAEVTIIGDTGVDELTINDTLSNRVLLSKDSYYLDREFVEGDEYGTFLKGRVIPHSPPQPEGFGPELRFIEIEDVTLDGSLAPDTFNVNRTLADVTYELKGNDSSDTFNVGAGDFDTRIRGPVTIVGGDGTNELYIDDRIDTLDDDYILSRATVDGRPGHEFTKESTVSNVPAVQFVDIADVTIDGSNANNTFDIETVRVGVTVTANGNNGEDTFNVGLRDFDTNIGGTVIVRGGNQTDTLNIDDQGDLTDDDYTITASTFTKSMTDGRVTYSDIQTFTFDANPRKNTIEVLSTSATLIINAHAGDDTILLSPVDMNLDLIRGWVSVNGGEGTDAVVLNDRNFLMNGLPGTLPYILNPAFVQKIYLPDPLIPYGKFPGLGYGEIEDLAVHAANGANNIVVSAPLLSNVTISGGSPTTSPGDSLTVVGTVDSVATYTTGTVGAGEIVVDGQTISFSGIEQPLTAGRFSEFTLAVDNLLDDLWIRDDGDDYTSISGQRDPANGPAVLRFRDVATFVLDGAAIDVSSDWTVEAGALNADGLSQLELLTGSDLTIVHDRTLEGPATSATLAVRNLSGGAAQHLVYGTADALAVASVAENGQRFVYGEARADDGTIVHQFEDEGVNNLFIIDRQRNVNLSLHGENARLLDGGSQLFVTGTGLTNLWLPNTADGRIRVRPLTNMSVEIQSTIFPNFQFDPIYGLDISPIGKFHVRPVNTNLDGVPGSLRSAIEQANLAPADGTGVVFFAFEEDDGVLVDPGVVVLEPLSALPPLTRGNTIINGASQQALTGDTNPFGPEIVLAGSVAGADASGLHLASSGNRVHGLNIQGFSGDGVLVTDDGNILTGNYIGTTATGDAAAGNAGAGVSIKDSSRNLVGGTGTGTRNVIGGNGTGVAITGLAATANQVAGNSIGLGVDGHTLLGNAYGVDVVSAAAGNLVGGTFAGEGNVISASAFSNVRLAATAGTRVQGNLIGTDALGEHITAYSREGVRLDNDRDSLIGGSEAGAGNTISGTFYGIYAVGSVSAGGTHGLRIEGNRIGTTADGRDMLANFHGIYLDGYDDANQHFAVHDVTIGGTEPRSGNLVSGNQVAGIIVRGPNATGIAIQGNRVGTDVDGTEALPNGTYTSSPGILIESATGVLVEDNLISGNIGYGVSIEGGGNHTLTGNDIGTTADGMAPLGNSGDGVRIVNSSGNQIGGTAESARNVISGNSGNGVTIEGGGALPSLVSAWQAEDSANDSAGNHDGQVVGTGFATGALGGQAFLFDGIDDYVRVPNAPELEPEHVTLTAWVNSTTLTGSVDYFVVKGAHAATAGSYALYQINGNAYFYIFNGTTFIRSPGISAGAIYDGQWHQLTGTYDGSHVRLYVDGREIGTGTATSDAIQYGLVSSNDLFIGSYPPHNGTYNFAGAIDEVALFSEALTAEQIVAHFASKSPIIGGNRIQGNFIGTTADGMAALGNAAAGIAIHDSAANLIGGAVPLAGNLIAGNAANGIAIVGGSGHVLQSNLIGTNADGHFKLGNLGHGISVENSSGNTIGGLLKGDGNIVAFSGADGITLSGVFGGTIAGNLVGTDRLGRFLGNAGDGISLHGSNGVHIVGNAVGASAGTGVRLVDSSSNHVLGNGIGSTRLVKPVLPNEVGLRIQGGGGNTIDGNIISGNTQFGIHLGASSGNTLSNNAIGVASDGLTPIGNGTGVVVAEASSNTFQGNTISGNLGSGVELVIGSDSNRFFGNRIGTNADGTLALGNGGFGVLIGKGSSRNFIGIERDEYGNDDPAQANTIAWSALAGVAVIGDAVIGNSLRGNSIHSNGGLGIDLGADQVTANDYGDPKAKPDPIPPDLDLGPNNLQNYPDVQQVTVTAKGTKVLGQLHSVPATQFIIDFYASSTADPSGQGEGPRWLGSKTITTGDQGVGAIAFDILPEQAFLGEFITTTSTNTVTGDTSEFSAAVLLVKHGGGNNLLAAEAPITATDGTLTMAQVEPLLSEAVARWNAAVPSFDVRIADLPGLTLGKVAGHTIWIDANAAGWGWFVDSTPGDDREFSTPGNQGEQERMDLLSVLMHELGHLLGHDHDEHEDSVMSERLSAGVRSAHSSDHDLALLSLLADEYLGTRPNHRRLARS